MKNIKILHLSGSHNVWGGNEKQLANLIKFIECESVENHIFCFKHSPIHNFCIENRILHCATPKYKDYSLKLAKILKEYVKNQKIDVIHLHTSNSVLTFMITDIFYNLKIPCVFSKKGNSDKSSFLSRFKYNYRGIDKIICVSKNVRDVFSKTLTDNNKRKLVVIYDGITIEKNDLPILNLREKYNIYSKYLIGHIANHSAAKDLPTFIRTVHYMVNKLNKKDIHFIQIGKELGETDKAKKMVNDYNLSAYITFTGELENADKLIPDFDVLLVTSKSEGGPLTIPEAFLAQTPVVSTKVGITEAMKDGEHGFLVEIGDYKAIAKKINTLLNDKSLQEKFIINASKLLYDKFDAKKNADITLKIYKECIS